MTSANLWQGSKRLVSYPKVARLGSLYVAEYRLRNMWKWKSSIVLFGLGNPVLYLASIGLGIGALVDANLPGGIHGVSYLEFIAPALLATAAIQSTMDETMFPTMDGFVWGKIFHAVGNTALKGRQIAAGVAWAAMIRTLFTVGTYYAVLLAFGALEFSRSWPLVLAAIYAGWGFGMAMLAMASFVKQDDGFFAIFGRFVITPMFLFSGTFYPLDILPTYLQAIGWISPLWHATDLGRFLSFDYPVAPWLLAVHVAYLLVLGLVGLRVAGWQYERRLAK